MSNIAHPDGNGRQQPDPDAYTILSAAYAEEGERSAVLVTAEAGALAIAPDSAPALWSKLVEWRDTGGTIAAFDPPRKRTWTLSELKARLQPGELAALGGLLGQQLQPADAALLVDFLTATTLSLADPGGPDGKLERGLGRLVALGVLTEERRQALLQPA